MKKWMYVGAIAALFVFLFLAFNYEIQLIQKLDQKAAQLLGGNDFIVLFHYFGETILIVSVAIVVVLFLWFTGNKRGILFTTFTLGIGLILNQTMKRIIERPRPDILNQLDSYSFPSGHSMMGMLYLLTIAYLLTAMTKANNKKIAYWVVVAVLVLMIGFSRVAEGRHYMSDVLAGWSLGFAWFAFCAWWYDKKRTSIK